MTQPLPLSIFQERIWVLDQVYPQNPAQNLSCGLRLSGSLDGQMLDMVLAEMLEQHEILRTEFHNIGGAPVQVVLSPPAINVAAIDLRHLPTQEREARLLVLAQEAGQLPFDLTHGPLVRATRFQLSDTEHAVLLVVHRIACDEASLKLLLRELYWRYQARVEGRSPQKSGIRQYRELATARETVPEAELSYWREKLAGAPSSIDLPTDRPRPALQSFRGAQQKITIEAPLLQQLQGLSASKGVGLFPTLLTAFYVLLFRHSRQEDIVVGTTVAGRGRDGFEGLIGPLENMLPLRAEIVGEPTFADLLDRVDRAVQGALHHAEVPFETLIQALHLERDLGRHPLFQVLFTLQNAEEGLPLPPGVNWFEVQNQTEQFDLSVECAIKEYGLEANFGYRTDLFDADTISRMMGHFRILLESCVRDEKLPISRMELLTAEERRQLLVRWNDTAVSYPPVECVHHLFEAQVERTPNATALSYENESLTYRQLNEGANQLAHYLVARGVGRGKLVAVFMERSIDMLVAALAILKAGAGYVPLDPMYPPDRLAFMLSDSSAAALVTKQALLARLPENISNAICVDSSREGIAAQSSEDVRSGATREDLVYVIYTSGSTGQPKGVCLPHRALTNLILWQLDNSHLPAGSATIQFTSLSFDVSFQEIFSTWCSGGKLVLVSETLRRDPFTLLRFLREQKIARLFLPFVALQNLAEAAQGGNDLPDDLLEIVTAGEQLQVTRQLTDLFLHMPRCRLYNHYGPSESHVVTSFQLTGAPDSWPKLPSIGKPIANTQIYILDPAMNPVPVGVCGELYIGGIALAHGYLNRPELNAAKFIPNLYAQTPGSRLYKTSDLARFLPDGNIEYLGRGDQQIKIRGFRVELGEIENALTKHTAVQQAVVTVWEDVPGNKRLVAYVLSKEDDLDVHQLRRHLAKTLPEYMVPATFLIVKKFPLTPSGKVDRKALPAPPIERGDLGVAVAPRTELESQLASAFARTLGLDSVGVTDNFFDLGGHSLTAARLLTQVREITGRQIPLSALFSGATVESLVRYIHDQEVTSDPVIMEIQRGDSSRLPFFAIVPPGEESLGYAILARHMGPDQTVYKVQGHTPIVGKRPYTEQEMQSLAVEYVMAIQSVQLNGPYCLGGLCDGAHIAERVVMELEAQGQEVALFAVIDTWVLHNSQRPWLWAVDYFQRRLREASSRGLAEQFQFYKQAASNRIQRLMGKLPARTDWQDTYWPRQEISISYTAPVVLFKRPKQPYFYVKDPQMGWGARTKSGVEIHEIDFDHDYLLREPHVRVLGEKLATSVKRVGQERSRPEEHEKSVATGLPATSTEDLEV